MDLILSSETIYSPSSVPSLISTIRSLSTAQEQSERKREGKTETLVAAKVLYFGVGGGLVDFTQAAEADGAQVETIERGDGSDGSGSGVARGMIRIVYP